MTTFLEQIVEGNAPYTQLKTAVVTVVSSQPTALGASLTGRRKVLLKNLGSVGIYIGTSTTTPTSGWLLSQNDALEFEVASGFVVYGLGAGTTTISILEAA